MEESSRNVVLNGCTIIVNRQEPRIKFIVHYRHIQLYLKGITDMVLQADQKVDLSIEIVDKKGNPALVDGFPVWSVSDETLAMFSLNSDAMGGTLIATGPIGHVQVSVVADADLGDGVKPIIGTLEVDIVGGEAAAIHVVAGAPLGQ